MTNEDLFGKDAVKFANSSNPTATLMKQAIENACLINKDKIRKDPRYQKIVQSLVDDSEVGAEGREYPPVEYDAEEFVNSFILSDIEDMMTEDMQEIGRELDKQPHPHDLNMEYQREVLG
jgi:hypothetical protein